MQIDYKILFFFSGKVHGSLARAGKVKAQTPKVKIYFNLGYLNKFMSRGFITYE